MFVLFANLRTAGWLYLAFLTVAECLSAQEPEASLIVVYDSHPNNQFPTGDTITVGHSMYIQGYWPGGGPSHFLVKKQFRGAGSELATIQTFPYEYYSLAESEALFIAQKDISVTPGVNISYVEGEVVVYQIVYTNLPGDPPQQALVELSGIGSQGMFWLW